MAHSLGYKLFKTDCIEDMPFEQFKVLVYANANMNKAMAEATNEALTNGPRSGSAKSTTYRIMEE